MRPWRSLQETEGSSFVVLPPPSSVLPSNAPTRCSACGQQGCTLPTHAQFTRTALNSRGPPLTPNLRTGPHGVRNRRATEKAAGVFGDQIGNPRMDPFAQYPLPMTSESFRLLDLWTQSWANDSRGPQCHLFPRPIINIVLPHALKHACLFQCLLAVSATQWSLACGGIDDVALRHQQAAIELHSHDMAMEDSASSDANILSALAIMSNTVAQGKNQEATSHMTGINHLVISRGGPQYLGMHGLVAECLLHADHFQAAFHATDPVWSIPLPSLHFKLPFEARMGQAFRMMRGGDEIDYQLLLAAQDMCRLVELIERAVKKEIPMPDPNLIGYLRTVVEYQLAKLNVVYHETYTRSECVCLALLMVEHVVVRNTGAIHLGVRKLEKDFWLAFQGAQSRGCWSIDNNSLLVWVLMMGLSTLVRAESFWKGYAIEILRKLPGTLSASSWDEVKSKVLNPHVWSQTAQGEVFEVVWREVRGFV